MIEVKNIMGLNKVPNANPGDLGQGIVRLNTQVKAVKEQGIKRNSLVSITNRYTSHRIYAIARSNNNLNKDTIGLEHDQRLALGFDNKGFETYEVRKATILGYFDYFRKHPNPQTRLTFLMGLFANMLFALLGACVGFLLSLL